jgi:hypothetical protein
MKIAKIRGFRLSLRRVVTVCACCLFLVSVLSPFVTVPYHTIIPEDDYHVTYWSHRATVTYLKLRYVVRSENLSFSTYWFAQQEPYSYPTPSTLGVSWVLISMFLIQILTLGFGFATLFRHGKSTLLPPISCLFVTFLMVYVMAQAQNQTFGLPKYELGYWLCYPSTILFLCAFILHLVENTWEKLPVQ